MSNHKYIIVIQEDFNSIEHLFRYVDADFEEPEIADGCTCIGVTCSEDVANEIHSFDFVDEVILYE